MNKEDIESKAETEYMAYLKEARSSGQWCINNNQENFDKQLITLSSSLLVASLGFFAVKSDIFPHIFWLISLSWGFLVSCIICTLISYLLSISALRKEIDELNHVIYGNKKIYIRLKTKIDTVLKFTNMLAGLFFAAGIVCSVFFVGINIGDRQIMDKSIKLEASIKSDTSSNFGQEKQCSSVVPYHLQKGHVLQASPVLPAYLQSPSPNQNNDSTNSAPLPIDKGE